MHTATEMLIADHRQVVNELDKLEALLFGLEGEKSSRKEMAVMGDFINTDINNHFLREEKYLFPLLADIPGMTEGPLKLIKYEHDEYWNISLKFLELLERWLFDELNNEEQGKLKKIGLALIALLRVHIDKEDNVLFPMVEHYLDNKNLLEAAKKIRFTEGPVEVENDLIIMDISYAKKRARQQQIIDTFNDMPPGKEIKIIKTSLYLC